MKKYFADCKTLDELKKAYRRTAKELHPDSNPGVDTSEAFKAMQMEFEAAFNRVKNLHVTDHDEPEGNTETAEEFMDLINRLSKIHGIEIEVCGSWVWVTGNTKPVKEALKSCGMRFSGNKQAWYYHTGTYRKRGRRKMTLNAIRTKYGSQQIENEEQEPNLLLI